MITKRVIYNRFHGEVAVPSEDNPPSRYRWVRCYPHDLARYGLDPLPFGHLLARVGRYAVGRHYEIIEVPAVTLRAAATNSDALAMWHTSPRIAQLIYTDEALRALMP